jgi:hypothetical protein
MPRQENSLTSLSDRHRFFSSTVLLAFAALSGCAGQSVVSDGVWREGVERNQSFSRVMVVAVSPDINQRCAYEQDMADSLRSTTVTARSSCNVMGAAKEPLTLESVEAAVAAFGADAVLATRLVDSSMGLNEGGTRESRGDAYYKPIGYGYDMGYWGAYGVPVVYGQFQTAPSVITLQGTAQITTTLFETRSATPVYTIETRATNLESREQALAEIVPTISQRLRQDGLIR